MEQKEKIPWKPCSRSFLKMVAMLSMLCDHIAFVLVPADQFTRCYYIMRIIGRIAFPLFCFMLVEGFIYTHSKKNYIIRLALFAVISEIPFDLACSGMIVDWSGQNVMWTLLIGFIVMYWLEKYENNVWLRLLIVTCGCVLAYFMYTDYSFFGVLIIAVLYLYRMDRIRGMLFMGILLVVQNMVEAFAVFSIPFILLYNPEKGGTHLPKYFFYAFYPVHLLLLYIIYRLI